jgi:hypothetical protein
MTIADDHATFADRCSTVMPDLVLAPEGGEDRKNVTSGSG